MRTLLFYHWPESALLSSRSAAARPAPCFWRRSPFPSGAIRPLTIAGRFHEPAQPSLAIAHSGRRCRSRRRFSVGVNQIIADGGAPASRRSAATQARTNCGSLTRDTERSWTRVAMPRPLFIHLARDRRQARASYRVRHQRYSGDFDDGLPGAGSARAPYPRWAGPTAEMEQFLSGEAVYKNAVVYFLTAALSQPASNRGERSYDERYAKIQRNHLCFGARQQLSAVFALASGLRNRRAGVCRRPFFRTPSMAGTPPA